MPQRPNLGPNRTWGRDRTWTDKSAAFSHFAQSQSVRVGRTRSSGGTCDGASSLLFSALRQLAARGARAGARAAHRRADARCGTIRISGPLMAFLDGLQQLGWADGRNVRIDTRWPATKPTTFATSRPNWSRLAPDVILAVHAARPWRRCYRRRRSVPIVFAVVIDPVGAGFVESLAQPGGNATGFTAFEYNMSGKWLELLKEIASDVRRAAVLRDPTTRRRDWPVCRRSGPAPSLGMELSAVDVAMLAKWSAPSSHSRARRMAAWS